MQALCSSASIRGMDTAREFISKAELSTRAVAAIDEGPR